MNIDLNAYYLVYNGYRHKILRVEKVNDKSIRMSDGTKILKEQFENMVTPLTKEEELIYRGELIKSLSPLHGKISAFNKEIQILEGLLNGNVVSSLLLVNSDNLQARVTELADNITELLPKSMEISGEMYVPHIYCPENLIREEH